jgi:type IV pilus assembly protein PilV
MRSVPRKHMQGVSLLEVLVTIVIVVIGLLGIAGLQARAHVAELESYQRAQALVLLYDMVDRVNNNREAAACYAVTTDAANGTPYLGTVAGGSHFGTPACGVSTTAANTLANSAITAWDDLLRGAAEKKGAGATEVGAMIGARGCVSYDSTTEFINATSGANIAGTGIYTLAVSWQGMADTFAPTVACGKSLYGSETKRRTVWVSMRLATLAAH